MGGEMQRLRALVFVGMMLSAPLAVWGAPHKVVEMEVQGMACQFCVYRVKKSLSQAPGVTQVEVSLEAQKARIALKPGREPDLALYEKLIRDAGFSPGRAQVFTEGK